MNAHRKWVRVSVFKTRFVKILSWKIYFLEKSITCRNMDIKWSCPTTADAEVAPKGVNFHTRLISRNDAAASKGDPEATDGRRNVWRNEI